MGLKENHTNLICCNAENINTNSELIYEHDFNIKRSVIKVDDVNNLKVSQSESNNCTNSNNLKMETIIVETNKVEEQFIRSSTTDFTSEIRKSKKAGIEQLVYYEENNDIIIEEFEQ